jgi:hypothetical protein
MLYNACIINYSRYWRHADVHVHEYRLIQQLQKVWLVNSPIASEFELIPSNFCRMEDRTNSWVEFILRPTVSRPVRLGIGPPFGAHDQIYLSLLIFFFWLTITFILFPMASSLTRKWVCSLECLRSLVRSLTTSNHTLPSHPRLCSLSVASYDYGGSILSRLRTGNRTNIKKGLQEIWR